MTDLDYGKFTRQQKLAIFLIIIGPEAAADVLRQFDDAEIELICREMSTFTVIPTEVQKLSLEEFSSLVAQGIGCALGGLGYAQRTLEIAKGDYKASTIMGRVGPVVGRGHTHRNRPDRALTEIRSVNEEPNPKGSPALREHGRNCAR